MKTHVLGKHHFRCVSTHIYCLTYACFTLSLQSYAGKYVPALAYRIHLENQGSPKVKINLKGVAIGDGLVDPVNVSYDVLLLPW